MQCIAEHFMQLSKACRAKHRHARNGAQVIDIENTVVRFAVVSDKSRPVYREHHMEILQRDIVDKHIEASLQKA